MDELFARKLGNMEVLPPEDGWIRIENELNRRNRMTRRYWLAAASFALVLSATATMVYIQTSVTSTQDTTVSVLDNTPQRPLLEQPVVINEDNEAQKTENRSMAQRNEAQRNENDISMQQSENNLPEPEGEIANISVYPDTWDELLQMQPVKVDWRKIMSGKIAQLKMENTDKKTNETVAVATTGIPVYDEMSYADFTGFSTKSQPRRRWEFTGQFAPVHSYRTISSVPGGIRKSDFDDAEKPLLAYSGGVNLSYRAFSRWSVQTGVFYSQMGQTINSVIPVSNMYGAISSSGNPYTKNFINTSSGSASVVSNLKSDANTTYSSYFNAESSSANSVAKITSPTKYKLIERLDYIEIPLTLQYRIFDRKLNLYVSGGMSANILINNNVFVDNGSEIVKGGIILMARPVNYSSIMGLGLGYQINRNLSVGFEPYFKYFLQPYTTSTQINSNPYALGVFTGVVYRF